MYPSRIVWFKGLGNIKHQIIFSDLRFSLDSVIFSSGAYMCLLWFLRLLAVWRRDVRKLGFGEVVRVRMHHTVS